MKTIIERGASWTLDETKLLLSLWGQDFVQRQATNTKRTKEVYEKISEKFNSKGYERTADQVRTRVFNMIAEYRRILKDQDPERKKKCIFFEALHKIYQAKHFDDVSKALDDYEPDHPYSPFSNTISSDKGDESISDSEAIYGNDINNATGTATIGTNANSTGSTNQANDLNNDGSSIDNNGDSIASGNNLNNRTNSTETSTHHHGSSSSKKIKLDPSKGSAQNQASNTNPSASTSAPNASTNSVNENSKQTRSSISLVTTSNTGTSTSSQKHQSLLLPHATTSASNSGPSNSTPISKLTTGGTNTPSYININSTKLPIIRTNQLIGHTNGNESINLNGTATRLPTTAITSHQLYQAPVNTFDVTSSALLIDRMFAHLSRESENMREWIALEKERLALERARRQQEAEREARREKVLTDTLMKFQDQWLSFLSKLDPRVLENTTESPPELKVPPRDGQSTSEGSQGSTIIDPINQPSIPDK